MKIEINPKVKDFLEEHKDVTIIGFAWACYWRLTLVVMVVWGVLALIASLFS